MNITTINYFLIFCFCLLLSSFLWYVSNLIGNVSEKVEVVNCSSDSMGMVMQCGDKLIVDNFDQLILGNIYIYEADSHTIAHRYVLDCREGCYGLIFKGDNNYKAELVNESQVIYAVSGVEYNSN